MRRDASLCSFVTRLKERPAWRWQGHVIEANGQTVESAGPPCSMGENCEIVDASGRRYAAEVIGFRGPHVLSMPMETTQGIGYGDKVAALGGYPRMAVGDGMRGRLLDAVGQPLDGLGPVRVEQSWSLDGTVPLPLERELIREPISTGVRALDGMLTVGRGQRVGIFGGSGVGKSTLIGMMTRGNSADVTVVGLVGERGREVREFVEESLGAEGREKSVVIVSTSDQSPLLRMRAALAATSVAEFYAAKGKHVLLVLDSLTRYAMAAREVGLAAGEPPTSKGYTPSVFARLAKLVERAGNFSSGSITAFYTVLMEGDDQQDPLVDAARSLLDGHVVLSRDLAAEGWYPPIDILDSISRLMPSIASQSHREVAADIRKLLAAYARSDDLIRIGAYKEGADEGLDRAIRSRPAIRRFLEQRSDERVTFADSLARLNQVDLT